MSATTATATEPAPAQRKGSKLIAAFVIPFAGFVLAIVAFTRDQVGFGVGLLLTASIGVGVWTLVILAIVAAGANDYQACIQHAQTLAAMARC